MREILFRGKRLDNGEWVEGTPFHRKSFYGSPDDRYFILTGEELHFDNYEAHEVDPSTIGQFTGLLDKNGGMIFEGDKVSRRWASEPGIIIWLDDSAKFCIEHDAPGTPVLVDFDVLWGHECEVIGNIHDNPELLKGGEVDG